MADLMSYAARLETQQGRALPPVERWDPPYCGELDLIIRADGVWIHEGTPIGRARLVRLFSTVLKREGDRFFFVTPVEKLGVRVEDAPFLAVLMRIEGSGSNQRLIFTTNVGDEVIAGRHHKIEFRQNPESSEGAPYIMVRAGLEAKVSRAVFYDLVALGKTREIDGVAQFGVWSDGAFFPFGLASTVFSEA